MYIEKIFFSGDDQGISSIFINNKTLQTKKMAQVK